MFLIRDIIRNFAAWSLLLAAHAHAQSSSWTAASGNWGTATNWSPASVPVSGSSTSLFFGGNASYTTTNDLGAFSLNQLRFSNTAGTVTLNGSPTTNALTFKTSIDMGLLPAVQLTGAGSATISAPVTWEGESVVTNSGSGTLLFNGSQTYTNGTKQTFSNAGSGTITLADGIVYASTGTNTGLVLNLINNSSTGAFNIGDVGDLGNVTFNIGGTGVVRFNGSNAGDLFSDTARLHVLSGATFDFNENGETMGAISGAGTIRQNLGLTLTTAGYYVFSGKLTGTGANAGLTVGGSNQTLVLSGATSDYTGVTRVTAGRLIVSTNAPNGSAGALGNATSDVLVGFTSGSSAASLVIDTAGVSIGRNVRVQSGNTGLATVGGLNTSGTVTYGGNLILGTDSGAAKGVTIQAAKGGTVEFIGNLLRATAATGGADTLTVTGGGTVALRGSNTFTGATTVNAGTLVLDHATNNGAKLSSTASLTLNGGSLNLVGHGGASSSQTVNGLTLGNLAAPLGGGGRITVTSGLNQNATVSLGGITRNTGATVDFGRVNTGSGTVAITTSTGNNPANILGAYATSNRNDWAVNDGAGNIASLAAGSYTTVFDPGLHTSLSANTTLPSGGDTTNTLRFTSAAALAFDVTTQGTLTLESGGILVASTAGATSIGAGGRRGTITPTTGELIIHQQSTSGTLTINAFISGTTLTKSGEGTLALTGNNTYTGNTIINGGTVSVIAALNLGAVTSDVTINGGTLALLRDDSLGVNNTLGTLNSTNRVITVGPSGATFDFAVDQAFGGGGLAGTGTLTKTGAGITTFASSSNSFNGDIFINAGAFKLFSAQLNNVASITIANGGTYEVSDVGAATFSLAAGGRFLINGNGLGGNGALRLTDQTGGTAGGTSDPNTTIDREVVLQTTARIQVENGAATGSLSQLNLTGNVTGPGGLVKSGTGLLALSARDNTYSGGTAIEAGTLRLDLGHDRLPTGTTVTLGAGTTSGTLQLNGFTQTIAGLTTAGSGSSNAVIGGAAATTSLLAVNVAAGSQTYSGTLGGTGASDTAANNNLGLIKDGAGRLILSGSNTYTGPTQVSAGVLEVSGSINGTTQVNLSGGTLLLAGANVINNAAVVNFGGGTLHTGGFSEGTATTTGLGVLTLSANSTLDFGVGTGSQLLFAGVGAHQTGSLSILNWSGTPGQSGSVTDDRLMFVGDDTARLAFQGLYSSTDISFNGVQGYAAIQYDAAHFEIVAVPEPSSTVLLGAVGLLFLVGCRERHRLAAALRSSRIS